MKFAIENDSVRQHGVNLTTTVEGLDQALQEFIGAVEALPGVWEGAAAQAFQQLQQRYQEAARQLIEAMQTIQEKVDTAGQEYDRGDQEQTQAAERVAAVVGGFQAPRVN